MEWFSKQLEGAGVGGAALQTAGFFDKSAAVAGNAGRSMLGALEHAARTMALAPPLTAIHLSHWDLPAVERTTAGLVKASVDTVFATARLAATPYTIATDALATSRGDAMKLGRGAIGAGLAAVNLVPFLLNRLSRLGGQTPEQIARALTTAPLEVVLASCLQAAHDVLEPLAKPIPKLARKLLEDHFDASLLDRARYIVSSFGLTVPEAVNGIRALASDRLSAFPVQNVIVFSAHPGSSEFAVRRWAYGLAHVEQCEKLGVDGWTGKYVRDLAELEAQAESRAERVASAVRHDRLAR